MFNVNDLTNVVKRMVSQRKSPVKRFFTFIVKFLMLEAVRKAAFRDFRRDQYTYCRVFAAFCKPRNGPERRRTEKVPQNFGHTIDLWADSV